MVHNTALEKMKMKAVRDLILPLHPDVCPAGVDTRHANHGEPNTKEHEAGHAILSTTDTVTAAHKCRESSEMQMTSKIVKRRAVVCLLKRI